MQSPWITFRIIFFDERKMEFAMRGKYSGKLIQIRLHVITDLHKSENVISEHARAAHDRNGNCNGK